MSPKKYIIEIEKIVDLIKISNPKNKLIFISPWMSLSGDLNSKVQGNEKKKLFDEYNFDLKEYCDKNNYLYVNPNSYLEKILNDSNRHEYMNDYIHPNNNKGIYLYSEAVLENSK